MRKKLLSIILLSSSLIFFGLLITSNKVGAQTDIPPFPSVAHITQSIHLYPGWNMISPDGLKVLPNSYFYPKNCGAIKGPFEWEGSRWGKMIELYPLKGYSFYAEKECGLEFTGVEGPNILNLHAGRNLVSTITEKSFNDLNVDCILRGKIRYQDSGGTYHELSADDILDPFKGYWIEVESSCQIKDREGPAGFDFTLSVNPDSGKVLPKLQEYRISTTVTAKLISGTSQSVSFAVSGLPSQATTSLSPKSCSPTCNSKLNISVSPATPSGTYKLVIAGFGGGITKLAIYTLTVEEEEPGLVDCQKEYGSEYWCGSYKEWSIECHQQGDVIKLEANKYCKTPTGEKHNYCVTCTVAIADTTPPFIGTILPTTALVGVPVNFRAPVSDNVEVKECSIRIGYQNQGLPMQGPPCKSCEATKKYTFEREGQYYVEILCQDRAGNGQEKGTTVTVSKPVSQFDFDISVEPPSATVSIGNSVSTNVIARLISGPTENVWFGIYQTLPYGITATPRTWQCQPSCSKDLTFSASPDARPGIYEITIFGEGGGLDKRTIYTLTVKEEVCECNTWSDRGCGQGGCAQEKMWRTRSCTPSGCAEEAKCVDDSSCITCTPQDHRACYDNDLYWYDSCGNRQDKKAQECGDDSCGNWGQNYCEGNKVYRQRTCYNKGCSGGSCYSNSYTDKELVKACQANETCQNGECVKAGPVCVNCPGTSTAFCEGSPPSCEKDCGANTECDEKDPNSDWASGNTCYWCGSSCGYGVDSSKPSDHYLSGSTCYYDCDVSCKPGGWSRACKSEGCDETAIAGNTCNYNRGCFPGGCGYQSWDTNKECTTSVCTTSGWDNSSCCPDNDGDGFKAEYCGGLDCDDEHADVYPGAPGQWSHQATGHNEGDYDCDGSVEIQGTGWIQAGSAYCAFFQAVKTCEETGPSACTKGRIMRDDADLFCLFFIPKYKREICYCE